MQPSFRRIERTVVPSYAAGVKSPDTRTLIRLDHQHLWHPFTHMKQWLADDPLVITDAEGMYLIDSDGRRYLDGVSSLWCNVHGHRVSEIDQAIRHQLERVAHTTMLGLASEPAIVLADRLMRLVPAGLKKIFYSDSGATATEIAFKLAVQYWHNQGRGQKNEFVGLGQGYHGDTVGAISVGRSEHFHRPYFPLLFKTHFAPSPDVFHSATPGDPQAVKQAALSAMARILDQHGERIAAVCVEPMVQGAAGMIVHPPGFLAAVRKLCDEHDVLLVADEVAVGFGRTGRMFACEHEAVAPDLLCVGKGISGGYLPLAATFATQRIFEAFLGEPGDGKTFFHGHTYTGNPLACAAALASLDLFEKNRVVEEVERKSAVLARMLAELRGLPHVGDVRQKGFMVGIELVGFDPQRRIGAAVCAAVRRHGVILRPLGDVIILMPPLAMREDDLRMIVDAVRTEIGAISRDG
jgi:adenosylmethionine-8-amino-7-oxononanoate aminotransferase